MYVNTGCVIGQTSPTRPQKTYCFSWSRIQPWPEGESGHNSANWFGMVPCSLSRQEWPANKELQWRFLALSRGDGSSRFDGPQEEMGTWKIHGEEWLISTATRHHRHHITIIILLLSIISTCQGLGLPMPRPYRPPYMPGLTALIPHFEAPRGQAKLSHQPLRKRNMMENDGFIYSLSTDSLLKVGWPSPI